MLLHPGGPFAAFVPVAFDVYRPLKPRLRWAMQCLVSFADHAGRCFPSLRTFALHAGISKSAAGRDLAELTEAGMTHPQPSARRRLCVPDRPALSAAMGEGAGVPSRDRQREARRARRAERVAKGVPERGTEEKPDKKNQGWARARAGIGNQEE